MNTARIAATVIASITAMTLYDAVIKPRITAAQGGGNQTAPSNGDSWASSFWPT